MKIAAHAAYPFDQDVVRNGDGWCAGISVALITHLRENAADQPVSPLQAMLDTRQYVDLLRASADRSMFIYPRVGFGPFRSTLARLQNTFDYIDAIPGRGIFAFRGSGIALMALRCDDWPEDDFGRAFVVGPCTWRRPRINHAGVIAWMGNEVFVFDPNVGAVLATWQAESPEDNPQYAVDHLLAQLYGVFDDWGNRYAARIITAKCIAESCLPFGRA